MSNSRIYHARASLPNCVIRMTQPNTRQSLLARACCAFRPCLLSQVIEILMSEKLIPTNESQKKRVVSVVHFIVAQHSRGCQCYFFDSDIGGFHYGPGHPYARAPLRYRNRVMLTRTYLKNEAHENTHVPFIGNELWSL